MTGITSAPPIFAREFESAAQTITAGGLLTLAHGLGVAPRLLRAELEFSAATAGYSIGERVDVSGLFGGFEQFSGNPTGLAVRVDATNIYVRMPSGAAGNLRIPHKSTGADTSVAFANADLVIWGWA